MFRESRLIHRSFPSSTRYEIEGHVIAKAGAELMRERTQGNNQVERGFTLGGIVDDTRVRINTIFGMDRQLGEKSAFHFGRAYDMIDNAYYGEGNEFVGMAHSHIPDFGHGTRASRMTEEERDMTDWELRRNRVELKDLEVLEQNTRTMIGLVLTVNEEGGGTITVYDGNGEVDFVILGEEGRMQEFSADSSDTVDRDLIVDDGIPMEDLSERQPRRTGGVPPQQNRENGDEQESDGREQDEEGDERRENERPEEDGEDERPQENENNNRNGRENENQEGRRNDGNRDDATTEDRSENTDDTNGPNDDTTQNEEDTSASASFSADRARTRPTGFWSWLGL